MATSPLNSTLARQLTLTVDIVRSSLEDDAQLTDIQEDAQVILLPNRRPDTILPTGEVLTSPDYEGYLLSTSTGVRTGDIVQRTGQPKLWITKIDKVLNVVRIQVSETQQ